VKRLMLAAALAILVPTAAGAAEGPAIPAHGWPSDGLFGRFDKTALQRGFQVYEQVCSACHSLKYIYFRNLTEIGLSTDQAKAIAAEDEVEDGPDDQGEMFTRPGKLSDPLPRPFPNPQAARAANNGALPPDLSLITVAREGGADYVYALLTGFEEPPEGFALGDGMNYNRYFPGHQIAMPPPLFPDAVTYTDGTPATVEQMAADVAQFLNWTAEPRLEDRKRIGIKTFLFLLVLAGLFFACKRKVWAKAH